MRIAVLGTGSQALRACEAIRKVPALRLEGVYGPDPARAAAAAKAAGTEGFHDLEALLARSEAVFVAGESHRHAERGLAAARAGRHVLVEKPIDVSPAAAEALVSVCRKAGVVLSVVSQKRFTPRFRRVRDVIASGALGRLRSGSLLMRARRPEAYFREGTGWRGDAARGGGVLLNQGVHMTDLLGWWFGDFEAARGFEAPGGLNLHAPETVGGAVRFASGAVASLVLTAGTSYPMPEFIEVVGEKGAIQIEGGRVRAWDVEGQHPAGLLGPLTRKLPLPLRTALHTEALASPVDGKLEDQLADFARSARDGTVPSVTGEDGLRALRLALALSSSTA